MDADFQRGSQLYERGDYGPAAAEFHRVRNRDPRHAEAHALLALCQSARGRHERAAEAATAALALEPASAAFHLVRAQVLAQAAPRHWPDAWAAVRASLGFEPGNPAARLLAAQLGLRLGHFPAACADALGALKLAPNLYDALAVLGHVRLARGDADLAERTARELNRLHPRRGDGEALLGHVALARGQAAAAEAHFRAARKLDPRCEAARAGAVYAPALVVPAAFTVTTGAAPSLPAASAFRPWLARQGRRLVTAAWVAILLYFVAAGVLLFVMATRAGLPAGEPWWLVKLALGSWALAACAGLKLAERRRLQ